MKEVHFDILVEGKITNVNPVMHQTAQIERYNVGGTIKYINSMMSVMNSKWPARMIKAHNHNSYQAQTSLKYPEQIEL